MDIIDRFAFYINSVLHQISRLSKIFPVMITKSHLLINKLHLWTSKVQNRPTMFLYVSQEDETDKGTGKSLNSLTRIGLRKT